MPSAPSIASAPTDRTKPGTAAGLLVLLALALAGQLVVLYAPLGGGPAPFPHSDKAVHVAVFLVPVALALLAGFRRTVVVAVFAAHAVVSEVVQAVMLPHRSGDVRDAVADLAGVALGVLVAVLVGRAMGRGPARRSAG